MHTIGGGQKKGKDVLYVKNGITYTVQSQQGASRGGASQMVVVPGAMTGKPTNAMMATTTGIVKGLTTH
jgi:hypothetical protein